MEASVIGSLPNPFGELRKSEGQHPETVRHGLERVVDHTSKEPSPSAWLPDNDFG
jgi:hypothetical protein